MCLIHVDTHRPNNIALAGFQLSAQSICLTASNVANLLFSNGVQGTLGL